MYNTFNYIEYWKKRKKEIPRELKTGVAKFMHFTYRRLCSVLDFKYLFVSPAMAQYILVESTKESGFYYYILLICCLKKIRSSKSEKGEQQEVANDKNQTISNNSSNIVIPRF